MRTVRDVWYCDRTFEVRDYPVKAPSAETLCTQDNPCKGKLSKCGRYILVSNNE